MNATFLDAQSFLCWAELLTCELDLPMTPRSVETPDSAEGDLGPVSPLVPEDRVALAMDELRKSGWYWGSMNVNEAKELLQDAPAGTFLLRDSSHAEYLLTISVKTTAGPTNLRIEYQEGKFRLDSIFCVRAKLKQFESVVRLVEYYVLLSKDRKTESESLPSRAVHFWLTRPLYASTPSLQHLCRLTVNKYTRKICELPLPTRLKDYLTEYQYHV